jgi:hypothetical protein
VGTDFPKENATKFSRDPRVLFAAPNALLPIDSIRAPVFAPVLTLVAAVQPATLNRGALVPASSEPKRCSLESRGASKGEER